MKTRKIEWYGMILLVGVCQCLSPAQNPPTDSAFKERTAPVAVAEPVVQNPPGDMRVTINVEDTLVSQILNAFSKQTGRSIVIGPEIVGRTTARLNNVPWDEALDAVLKPFSYGHYEQGNATVVCGVDPVHSQVFTIKYLDASDVEEAIQGFLSPRGKISRVTTRSQSWANASQSGGSSVAGGDTMGRRQRELEAKDISRTKKLVVTDEQQVLNRIAVFLDQVDRAPSQILIEARFMEINPRVLRDVGVEFGTDGGFATGGETYGYGVQTAGSSVSPGNFTPVSTPSLASTAPFNAGMNLIFQKLTGTQYSLLLHFLQEDSSANVLSAPRILTLNNLEASIIVGTKYPIINSEASDSGGTATITTSLRGYEDIGIQLNVLPQICDDNMINMTVRPSVRELLGTKAGKTVSGATVALTEYPVISTREAETQVILENGQTIVIGGLLKDRESKVVIKVPFLGSIPIVGWLFRRETVQTEKIDLLIFLTASIVPAEGSALTWTNIVSKAVTPEVAARKAREKAVLVQKEAAEEAKLKAADEKKTEEAKAAEIARQKAEDQQARETAIAQKAAEKKAAEAAEQKALTEKKAAEEAKAAEIDRQKAEDQKAREAAIAKKATEEKAWKEAALAAAEAKKAAAEKQALAEKKAAEKAKQKALDEKKAAEEAKAAEIARQKAEDQKAREAAIAQRAWFEKTRQDAALAQIKAQKAAAEKKAAGEAEQKALAEKQAVEKVKAAEIARQKVEEQQAREEAIAQKAAEEKARKEAAVAKAEAQLAAAERKVAAQQKALAEIQAVEEVKTSEITRQKVEGQQTREEAIAPKAPKEKARKETAVDKAKAKKAAAPERARHRKTEQQVTEPDGDLPMDSATPMEPPVTGSGSAPWDQ